MPRKYKYPFLYNKNFWEKNQSKTNVDIGKEFNCPSSTVRASRHKMGFPPLPGKWLTEKQWQSLDQRKKRSSHPILYEKSFWEKNNYKTNSEIAKELGCSNSCISTARKFLGIPNLTRSEAQRRRYNRVGLPKKRIEIDKELRKKVMGRANYKCEFPNCGIFGDNVLHVDHIKDETKFKNPKDANYMGNLIVLCDQHHKWWAKYKKTDEFKEKILPYKNRYNKSIKILNGLFPSLNNL